MKTSITDIIRTERFLKSTLPGEDRVVFEARLLVDPELRADTVFHSLVHRMVALYHRRKLKADIEAIHDRLFSDPSRKNFSQSIVRLFKS